MTTNTTEYYQLSQFPKIEDRNTILNETTDDNKKIDKALRNHHNRIVVIEEDKLKIHSSINSITEKLNTDETQIEANKKAITDINNMSDGTTVLNQKITDKPVFQNEVTDNLIISNARYHLDKRIHNL